MRDRLGIGSLTTLNSLIRSGVIPGPLPGSRFLFWPSIVAALQRASGQAGDKAELPSVFPQGPAR